MPLRDDLLNPIPGDNPSGANLRYVPVYDQIKEARREEDATSMGVWERQVKKADYAQAIKLASEALASKTKDLQIAAWLTESLVYREGFAGLKQGLDLLLGLLANFWDTLYPELEDGDAELRSTPLAWVAQLLLPVRRIPITAGGLNLLDYKDSRKIPTEEEASADENKRTLREEALADGKTSPEEFGEAVAKSPREFYEKLHQQVQGSRESLQALDDVCNEKFGEVAPNFAPLRECLEEIGNTVRILLQQKGGGVEAEPPAEEEQPAEGEISGAPPPRLRRAAAGGAEPADRDDAVARLAAIAKWFRREEPNSPVPYLLLRALRWGELRATGGSFDWSMLEAPPTEVRQQLKRLSQEAQWQEVIDAAEEAMAKPCGRAWLDLQRYVIVALEQMGMDFVAAAIRQELKALLADYPHLLDVTLTDDTQGANPQTREMFPPHAAAPPQAEGESEPEPFEYAAPAHAEGPVEPGAPDDEQLIKAAVSAGRLQEAIEIVSRRMSQETSGRARFHRKVQLAQICMASGHESVAYPILREVAAEIESRRLEQWEIPAVVSHPLALLYRCLSRVDGSAEEKEKVYANICRLDPVQALDLS